MVLVTLLSKEGVPGKILRSWRKPTGGWKD